MSIAWQRQSHPIDGNSEIRRVQDSLTPDRAVDFDMANRVDARLNESIVTGGSIRPVRSISKEPPRIHGWQQDRIFMRSFQLKCCVPNFGCTEQPPGKTDLPEEADPRQVHSVSARSFAMPRCRGGLWQYEPLKSADNCPRPPRQDDFAGSCQIPCKAAEGRYQCSNYRPCGRILKPFL